MADPITLGDSETFNAATKKEKKKKEKEKKKDHSKATDRQK